MDCQELALQLQKTDDRSVRNEGRIKKLEEEQSVLHQLATSVALLAQKMETMSGSVDTLTQKVDALEAEPAKKWRFVVEKSIYFAVGAVIAFLLSQVGL